MYCIANIRYAYGLLFRPQGCNYSALTWGTWLVAGSLLLSPFWFNPMTFSMTKVNTFYQYNNVVGIARLVCYSVCCCWSALVGSTPGPS